MGTIYQDGRLGVLSENSRVLAGGLEAWVSGDRRRSSIDDFDDRVCFWSIDGEHIIDWLDLCRASAI